MFHLPRCVAASATATQSRKHELCALWVRNTSRSYHNDQQQAHCIDEHVAFAAFDHLASIIATFAPIRTCLDALAIKTASRRMFVTPCLHSHLGTDGIVHALPSAVVAPDAEIPIHGLPAREVCGQLSPLATCHKDKENGVDNLTNITPARASTRFCLWHLIFDTISLASVTSVGYVRVCITQVYSPDYLTATLLKQALRMMARLRAPPIWKLHSPFNIPFRMPDAECMR